MPRTMFTIFLFSILIHLISCGSGSIEPVKLDTYTPLALGDVTQLIYMEDSSTTMLSIVDQARRKDGKLVFVGEFKSGTQNPTTSYYLISNGFFVATELEPVDDVPSVLKINPYREQRLAKSHPVPGEKWFHTLGSPDSTYFVAEIIDFFPTLFGEINDVYGFGLYHKNSTSPFLISYYSKDMGLIASSGFYFDPSEPQFLCSYKKVSGETYGELWPEKDFSDIRLKPTFNPHYLSKLILENKIMMINGEF